MCKHDPAYTVMNTANGGVGCPRCFQEIQEQRKARLTELQAALQLTPDEQEAINRAPVTFWTSRQNSSDPLVAFVAARLDALYWITSAARDDYRVSGAIEVCQRAIKRLTEWRAVRAH